MIVLGCVFILITILVELIIVFSDSMNIKNMKHTIILLMFSSLLVGQDAIITDRPDQSESASVINAGGIQIETGFTINNSDLSNTLQLPSTLFRLGLLPNLEIRVFNQIEYSPKLRPNLGFNNIELGAKLQLFQKDNSQTAIAFLSHAVIPSASAAHKSPVGLINKLCISHELNSSFNLGYNIGYSCFEDGEGHLTYSVVLGKGIIDAFSLYIEPYGEVSGANTHTSNINMGFTYLYKKNIQFDYSFGSGLNHNFNFISAGCSIYIN